MLCLKCRTPNIKPGQEICPNPACGVHLPSLFRDLLPPGTQLDGGKYEIEYALGRGGFGVTYFAQHKVFSRAVAIKEFFPQDYAHREGATWSLMTPASGKAPYERWLERFKREGQVLFDLNHPNIVRVQNLFEERNTVYLVMELLAGKTLKEELNQSKGKGLQRERVVEIMDALVPALAEVHQRNLFHLDLKPENVMVTETGRLVLLDFGAARQELSHTEAKSGYSSLAMSESYAPPELMAGEGLSSGTDIFELGMLLHELLTGELPPPAITRLMKRNAWESSLESPWNELIEAALRLEVSERPQNVAAWWGRYQRAKQEAVKVEEVEEDLDLEVEEDLDLEVEVALTSTEMSVGCQKEVNLPTGQITVKVPKGIKVTQRLRIPEKGKRSRFSSRQGDCYLLVQSKPEESLLRLDISHDDFNFEVVYLTPEGKIDRKEVGIAQAYQEKLSRGIDLEMVWIPGGRFRMGASSSDKGKSYDEEPQHEVNISSFYLGRYPVTQAQWEAVMGSNSSKFKGANRPVEQVNWNEVNEFCKKLSSQTGRAYRLSSESEWEYACRAGTTTPFYFGETLSPSIANYDGNYTYGSGPKGEYRRQTTDVGIFTANPFGLCDMHGNVREWCQDRWHENYNGAPSDGRAWENGNDRRRILRGGSWNDYPANCRSALRIWRNPGDRVDYVGFRLALSASGTS